MEGSDIQKALQALGAQEGAQVTEKNENEVEYQVDNTHSVNEDTFVTANDTKPSDQPSDSLVEKMDDLKISDTASNQSKKKKKKKVAVPNEGSVASRTRSKFAAYAAQNNKNKKQKVGVVYDQVMTLHQEHRAEHPERPERVMSIYLNLVKKGLYKQLIQIDSEEASEKDLLLCHPKNHVNAVLKAGRNKLKDIELKPKENVRDFAVDTYQNKFTAQAALYAAGSSVEAVRAVCSDTVDTSFAIVRPPGHHAHCAAAGGFCFFNNVGVAARVAQKELGVKKVAIFDWDVHVGDGTADIFYNDPSVLYMSIHRFDLGKFYPGPAGKHDRIGEGAGRGYNIHFPFNVQPTQKDLIGDRDYIFACEQVFFPIIKEFAPDLIIISAGFDSALGDPLGGIGVTPAGYAYMTQGLRQLCKKTAVVLEGGYDLEALEKSSEAVIRTLMINPDDKDKFNELLEELTEQKGITQTQMETSAQINVRPSFKQTACNVAKALKKQWPLLGHLIFEKPRRRTSSNMSNGSSSCQSPTGSFTPQFKTVRTQSMTEEKKEESEACVESNPRSRANSYQVMNPIEEDLKQEK